MTRERSAAERAAQFERLKIALRQDPTLSRAQLRERFGNLWREFSEARRQLQAEGVEFPNLKNKASCYR